MSKKLEKNLIVGLDIGTSKVVAIVGEITPDDEVEIIGLGSHPSRGLKKGVVVNIESTVQSIQRAVEEAELMAGCSIDSVYAGIAGSHIRSLNSHGIVAIRDKEVTAGDVERVIDARGSLVMPGLINTHVHLSQQLGRGLGDDVPLLTWLHDRIWPYESAMDLEDSHVSSLACCAELIRSGVTTFAEPGGQEVDGMARAVEEIGIRGILARSTMDCGEGLPEKWVETTDEALEKQVAHIEQWHGKYNPMGIDTLISDLQ